MIFSNIHRIYKSFIISAGLTLATLFEETYYLLSKKKPQQHAMNICGKILHIGQYVHSFQTHFIRI